ncbi:hypothetical protein QBC47DRAFT_168629 [Echria macrotheca]|uniref:gamma-glutamylcyclotransferase n=1 Tax=Echria macrotheca TaxID=438768 RepID=A0AAJ0BEV6_9PEZI|nr:hypothetical protein QBC47DRAFT_168629 [Echria macrotheca]
MSFRPSTPDAGTRPRTPVRGSGSGSGSEGKPYFAYGSNLHVAQMAQRCPESVFLGRAVLTGYRWQINQRGVANVVPSETDSVEGLVYLVKPKDERALDRSEGVSKGFYQRRFLPVVLETHRSLARLKSSRLARVLAPEAPGREQDRDISISASASPRQSRQREEQIEALVYVAEHFTAEGPIRPEYIGRMTNAVNDAIVLGISQAFIKKFIEPHLVPKSPDIPDAKASLSCEDRRRAPLEDTKSRSRPPWQSNHLTVPVTDADNPQHLVDLRRLKDDNLKLHVRSGMRFPAELLTAVAEEGRGSCLSDSVPRVYLVLVRDEVPNTRPVFEVHATTEDVEVANHIAMAKFRSLCDRNFTDPTTGMPHEWARSAGSSDRKDLLKWDINPESCLHLHASLSEAGIRATVWVERQVILKRF